MNSKYTLEQKAEELLSSLLKVADKTFKSESQGKDQSKLESIEDSIKNL
jgi:hypothetical protein